MNPRQAYGDNTLAISASRPAAPKWKEQWNQYEAKNLLQALQAEDHPQYADYVKSINLARKCGVSWMPIGLLQHHALKFHGILESLCPNGQPERLAWISVQMGLTEVNLARSTHLSPQEHAVAATLMNARNRHSLGIGEVHTKHSPEVQHCVDCDRQLQMNEFYVTVMDKHSKNNVWCLRCFRCTTCQHALVDFIYFWHHEKCYCLRHYGEQIRPRCYTCDELVFTREFTKAGDHSYHLEHFVCHQCECCLTDQKYVVRDAAVYCVRCYDALFSRPCQKCGEIISSSTKSLCFKDWNWHVKCFNCCMCHQSLIDQSFKIRNGRDACCVPCAEKAKMLQQGQNPVKNNTIMESQSSKPGSTLTMKRDTSGGAINPPTQQNWGQTDNYNAVPPTYVSSNNVRLPNKDDSLNTIKINSQPQASCDNPIKSSLRNGERSERRDGNPTSAYFMNGSSSKSYNENEEPEESPMKPSRPWSSNRQQPPQLCNYPPEGDFNSANTQPPQRTRSHSERRQSATNSVASTSMDPQQQELFLQDLSGAMMGHNQNQQQPRHNKPQQQVMWLPNQNNQQQDTADVDIDSQFKSTGSWVPNEPLGRLSQQRKSQQQPITRRRSISPSRPCGLNNVPRGAPSLSPQESVSGNNKERVINNSGEDNCHVCHVPFEEGEKTLEYNNQRWHEQCFTCFRCRRPIGVNSFFPLSGDRLLCLPCFSVSSPEYKKQQQSPVGLPPTTNIGEEIQRVSSSNSLKQSQAPALKQSSSRHSKCVKCEEPILEQAVTFQDCMFHCKCFVCTGCKQDLTSQKAFMNNLELFCVRCLECQSGRRCTRCHNSIACEPGGGGDEFISLNDYHYHLGCFTCLMCNVDLRIAGFVRRGEGVICKKCNDMLLICQTKSSENASDLRMKTENGQRYPPQHQQQGIVFLNQNVNGGGLKHQQQQPLASSCPPKRTSLRRSNQPKTTTFALPIGCGKD